MNFFNIYNYTTNGLGIALNLLLLLISWQPSIETAKELKYFLSNISLSAIGFSACLVLLQPQFMVRGSTTVRIPHGPAQYYTDETVKFIAALAAIFYFYGLLSYPLFFFYRTITLSNNTKWNQYFNKKTLLTAFVVIFLFSLTNGLFLYYANIPYQDLHDCLNETISNNTDFLASSNEKHFSDLSLNFTGVVPSHEPIHTSLFGDDFTKNSYIQVFHVISIFSHLLSLVVVLACSNHMMFLLNKKQHDMSRETYTKHSTLIHAIFFEAVLPLILAAPIAGNSILTHYFEESLEWQEYLPVCIISWWALLTPCFSLFCVEQFRKALWNFATFQMFNTKKIVHQESNDLDFNPADLVQVA